MQDPNRTEMVTHHIDGNKENNASQNLMTLPPLFHSTVHQIAEQSSRVSPPSIFIIGKAGSGKTTLASHVVALYGFRRVAFGDEIKRVAIEEFGMNPAKKQRRLLQVIGQVGRVIDEFVWIKRLLRRIEGVEQRIVIDDCRLLSEFLVLKLLGFYGVYLDCPESLRRARGSSFPRPGADRDRTETELESLRRYSDFVIDTSKPLQTSILELDRILGSLGVQRS